MWLIRLLRLLYGYVVFSASGGFPERFINLCASMQLPVWDLLPDGDGLCGKVRPGAFLRLRAAAKKAGVRLRIREKRGLPFLLRRRRSRYGLPIAAAVFLLTLCVLSSRIWIIDVHDADAWTRQAVRETLDTIGVREGMRGKALDASYAERALLLRMPDVGWVALNRNGAVLHVELRPAPTPPESENDPTPCHIVASRDGFLRRLEAYDGTPVVQTRTAVQKGQLLISGAVEHTNGALTLLHASGYAEAETTHRITCTLPDDTAFAAVENERRRIRVDLFSLRIPLGDPRPVDGALFFSYTCFCTAGDKRLPFSYTVYRSLLFGAPRPLSDGQRQLLLDADFAQAVVTELRQCELLQADLRRDAQSQSGTFRTAENIGREQTILTAFS